MENIIRISLAQFPVIMGDTKKNLSKAIEGIYASANEGVDIICFPELFYSGYDVSKDELAKLAEPKTGFLFKELSKVALEKKIHIIMGYPERDEDTGKLYISLMFIDDQGDLIGNHRKSCLWTMDRERVSMGDKYDVIKTKFGKIGMLICYEMEFPEPARILALKGAELIIISSAFERANLMSCHLSALAAQNSIYIAGVNNISGTYTGNSQFVNQSGETISKAMDKEELLIQSINLTKENRRDTYPAFYDFNNTFKNKILSSYIEAML